MRQTSFRPESKFWIARLCDSDVSMIRASTPRDSAASHEARPGNGPLAEDARLAADRALPLGWVVVVVVVGADCIAIEAGAGFARVSEGGDDGWCNRLSMPVPRVGEAGAGFVTGGEGGDGDGPAGGVAANLTNE